MTKIKRLGVLTSGGDSPGMNAAIRAVCRTAIFEGIEAIGIRRGYQGLIEGDMIPLASADVGNIIQRGGTILKTARSEEFRTVEGRQKAFEQLKSQNLDALVLIGGDGTFRGATAFFKEHSIPSIGLPGTIDNDMSGTDYTIGFDTAVNTAVEAIDKIRDTAEAHDRIFIVEVMGRDAGYIGLYSGISVGSQYIFIPEFKENLPEIIKDIKEDRGRKKQTNIIVVAEGDEFGGAAELENILKKEISGFPSRVTILGHIQRGGSPTANDRILASRLGFNAVMALLDGRSQEMVGIINNKVHFTPFAQCTKAKSNIPDDIKSLSTVIAK